MGDLAGFTVENFRALADEHAHRQHRAFADDHAFDNFGTRADKTIVLNYGGICLQGFEYPADPDTARQMNVLADLGTTAHRRPGIDHRA